MPDPTDPTATLHPSEPIDETVKWPTIASPAGFDADTRELLWWRLFELHIAAFVITVILGLLANAGATETPSTGRPPAWLLVVPAAQLLEASVGAVLLWRWRAASLRRLRQIEFIHFGVFLAVAGVDKYVRLAALPVADAGDPVLVRGYVAIVTQLSFVMPVVIYGTLIPNTPRRSLIGVGLMVGVAFLATALATAANPLLRPALPTLLLMCGVTLTIPSLAAVFVASRNHALRREVFAARRAAEQLGPYTLVRKLGEGGMGEVWLAEHRLMKRPCAVKFIRPEHATNPSAAARFEREVRAVTALTHFHTIRVYDYGRADDGGFYYVMEYLDGPTLESLVAKCGPLEPARAVYLLRQLCGALAEAHAAGLVHRDLKPGNVIVAALGGQRDVAKLLDFGLVHDTGSDADVRLTRTGTVVGTPAYMCPEQAGGEPNVDARGDIYSLGAVAFFALTGRPPFDEPNVGKMLSAHLTRTPPRVAEVRPDVPTDVADVVATCLEKLPGERFASAAELERALAACACSADWSPSRAAAWWDANSGRVCTPLAPRAEPTN